MRNTTLVNFAAVPEILSVSTNADRVDWTWGFNPTRRDLGSALINAQYIVDDAGWESEFEGSQRFHYWRSGPNVPLQYRRRFGGRRMLRMDIEGVGTGRPRIRVNSLYPRAIRFRFNNLHSPGYLLTDIACYEMLLKGLAPLHCSAFTYQDEVIVIAAAPNTGKTLTALRAVMEFGANFVAEDVAVTDGRQVWGAPYTSTFRYYNNDGAPQTRRVRARDAAMRVAPPLELLVLKDDRRTLDSLIDPKRVSVGGVITRVFFLELGPEAVTLVPAETARRRLAIINRYEFNYMKSPALVAASYFDSKIDLPEAEAAEQRILDKMVSNTECVSISVPSAPEFIDKVLAVL